MVTKSHKYTTTIILCFLLNVRLLTQLCYFTSIYNLYLICREDYKQLKKTVADRQFAWVGEHDVKSNRHVKPTRKS